ncbi:MAG: glycoside hydrolase family 26 protein [Acidimicrobiales bacterium]
MGALLGMSTGLSQAEREPRWEALETDAGRTYDIGHVFHAWDKAIPTADDDFHIADGRLLMISWNGTDTIEIADGEHDQWITSQAEAVRDLDRRVLLRWFWEMDGRRRLPLVHSGANYVAAWLHIRAIFDEVGAANAEFVWCPNDFLFRDGDPDQWYPGDDHVDWLCADGYNWADSTTSDEWLGIDEIFADFHEWAAPRGLPIVIAETGVGEAEPGAKAEWLRSLPSLLESELPEIDALVYFDKDFTDAGHRDWRLDTSPEAYEAWLEISADPWLNPLDR